jgi:hypothetical protein
MAGPQGVKGLTSVTGFVDNAAFATPEERLGNTADPRHGVAGEQAAPYPWEQYPGESIGPLGLDNQLLATDPSQEVLRAGEVYQDPTGDQQEYTRAAPWPKGFPTSPFPDDQQGWRAQENAIHSENFGASREMLYEPTLDPQNDTWTDFYEVNPGASLQVPVPDQLKSSGGGGYGTTDRVSSFARQNQYGFDSAHMHRRWATGSIPGNYMWLQPGGRPLVKSIAGSAQVPVGVNSPFYGQDPGTTYDSQGSALAVLPSEYVPPVDPALASSFPAVEGSMPSEFW